MTNPNPNTNTGSDIIIIPDGSPIPTSASVSSTSKPADTGDPLNGMIGMMMAIMMMSMLPMLLPQQAAAASTKGYIRIVSTPAGAEVFVDGVDMSGVTPCTITAEAGNHTVVLKLAGYKDESQVVTVVAGGTVNMSSIMEPETGTIDVTSTPTGAEIFVDNIDSGQIAPCTLTISTGSHMITARLSGYADAVTTVTIAAGTNSPISLTLSSLANKGAVLIESTPPNAAIWVNGVDSGKKTPATMTAPAGTYNIDLYMDTYFDHAEDITLEVGITKNIDWTLVFIGNSLFWGTPDGHKFPNSQQYYDYVYKNFTPIHIDWG